MSRLTCRIFFSHKFQCEVELAGAKVHYSYVSASLSARRLHTGQAQQILMYCGENIKIDYIGKRVLQVAAQEMSGAAIWLERACSTRLAGDLQQLEELH